MKNTVNLQGIGSVPGKAVKDLASGDIIRWNYGYRSKVLSLAPSGSGKMYAVELLSLETGKVRLRWLAAETLVGIA